MGTAELAHRLYDKFPALIDKKTHKKNANGPKDPFSGFQKDLYDQLNIYFDLKKRAKTAAPTPEAFSFDIITAMLGGTMERTKEGRGAEYYFEPLLDASDVMLIESSLITNRHLDEEDRRLLIDTLDSVLSSYARVEKETLLSGDKEFIDLVKNTFHTSKKNDFSELDGAFDHHSAQVLIKDTTTNRDIISKIRDRLKGRHLPDRRAGKDRGVKKGDSLLNHVYVIDSAIRNEYKLNVVYGKYVMATDTLGNKKLDFKAAPKRILNPYAIISSQGHYYLIATDDANPEKGRDAIPYHFRIDRIKQVSLHYQPNKSEDSGEKTPMQRAERPKLLDDYFDKKTGFFNENLYLEEHPLMGGYGKNSMKPKYIRIRATGEGIKVLRDYFGGNLKIDELRDKNGELVTDDRNLRKVKKQVYDIRFSGIYDDNLEFLATMHHTVIEVLEPLTIRDKVRAALELSLARYRQPV